jgi:predicted flap endonuclease-1-like 5' DNA nuclease
MEEHAMWDYTKILSGSIPPQLPGLDSLLETSDDKVAALESLVNQLLDAQHQMADSVTGGIAAVPGIPRPMVELTEQLHGMTESMLDLQADAWSGWFGVLRQMQGVAAPTNPATTSRKPSPMRKPVAVTPAPVQAAVSAKPVEAPEVKQPAAPQAPEPVVSDSATAPVDDLKLISGVGPAMERRLNEAGVFSYQQIAGWSSQDFDRIEAEVMNGRFVGRIHRDDWIGQAQRLSQSPNKANF